MGGLKSGKIVNDEATRAKIEAASKLIKRIEKGDADDVTGQEALARFGVVASKLSPEELEEATEATLNKLPEDQRAEFGKLLQDAGKIDADVDVTDVRSLAIATSTGSSGGAGIAGLLGGLLGGGGGGQSSGGLDVGSLLGGLLGGGGGSSSQQSGGLDVGGLIGGLLGGGGGSGTSSAQQSGGLDIGGLLGGLLGGGGGGGTSNAQKSGGLDIGGMLGGGGSTPGAAAGGGGLGLDDLINNPLVKSIIAGVAGNGMEKVVGNAGGIDGLLGGLLGGGDDDAKAPATDDDNGNLPNQKKGAIL